MQSLMSESELRMKHIYQSVVNIVATPSKTPEGMEKSLIETEKLFREYKNIEVTNLVERARKRNYTTKLLRLKSLLYHRAQKYEDAETAFNKAINEQKMRKYPHHDELCLLHFNLAKMYRQLGKYLKTEQAALGVIENFPKVLGNSIGDVGTTSKNSILGQSLNMVAHSCVQQGRYALAGDYYKRADKVFRKLGTIPERNNFYLDYADFLRRNGQNEDGRKLLRKHQALFEKNFGKLLQTLMVRGVHPGQTPGGSLFDAMGGIGQFSGGGIMSHFNHSLYPDLAYSYLEWGNYSFYLGEDEIAKKYWQKAHELMKKNGDGTHQRVNYYYKNMNHLFLLDEKKNELVKNYEFGDLSNRDIKDVLNRGNVEINRKEDRESLLKKLTLHVAEKIIPSQCSCCGKKKQDSLLRCSRCKISVYCSRECQIKDWKTHKLSCRKI